MEKENFDEELKNRIKQIFEEYDDGTADEGWNRLREKFPEKNRRDYFFWWIASVAALLLGILLFWFSSSNVANKDSKIVKQQPKKVGLKLQHTDSVYKNLTSNQKLSATKIRPDTKATSSANTKKTPVKTVLPIIANRLSIQSQVQPQKTEQAETETKGQVKTETNLLNNTVFTGIKKVSVADSAAKKTKVDVASLAAFSSKHQQEIIAQKASISSAAFIDSSQKKPQQIIAKTTNPVNKSVIAKKAETVKKLSGKPLKFGFGLFAGVHLNYAKGSNNQLGLGAGVFTDFRVAKNFKLSTGLGLLQNKLSYSQGVPVNSQLAANSYSAIAAQPVAVTSSVQTSSLKSMDASLLALDIPVNLTYTFLPGKNSISVSAGLSSNTFAREVYNYHYAVFTAANTGLAAAGTSMQVLQDRKNFSHFNFAKTLNLAAGFTYPLNKKELQIEPFLKYPLGGLGSQQLKFGSAGINLKMNLQSFKK